MEYSLYIGVDYRAFHPCSVQGSVKPRNTGRGLGWFNQGRIYQENHRASAQGVAVESLPPAREIRACTPDNFNAGSVSGTLIAEQLKSRKRRMKFASSEDVSTGIIAVYLYRCRWERGIVTLFSDYPLSDLSTLGKSPGLQSILPDRDFILAYMALTVKHFFPVLDMYFPV